MNKKIIKYGIGMSLSSIAIMMCMLNIILAYNFKSYNLSNIVLINSCAILFNIILFITFSLLNSKEFNND